MHRNHINVSNGDENPIHQLVKAQKSFQSFAAKASGIQNPQVDFRIIFQRLN
jgi:hypothetical protein